MLAQGPIKNFSQNGADILSDVGKNYGPPPLFSLSSIWNFLLLSLKVKVILCKVQKESKPLPQGGARELMPPSIRRCILVLCVAERDVLSSYIFL